jgi:hypothetical protein
MKLLLLTDGALLKIVETPLNEVQGLPESFQKVMMSMAMEILEWRRTHGTLGCLWLESEY